MPSGPAESPASKAVQIRIEDLRTALTPRLGPADSRHAVLLAQNYEQLPPILVHRNRMTIIDGTHRVLAARMLGHRVVTADFFEGSEVEAYVESVRANREHGKPLTLVEREYAARRVVSLFPEWSDRRIAELCGLSPKTIGGIRRRSTAGTPQLSGRVGLDGKTRPCDPISRRMNVARLLEEQPKATVRWLAEQAGTSQATVIDVRLRLQQGKSPFPKRSLVSANSRSRGGDGHDDMGPLEWMRQDAACRATPEGSRFAEWFEAHSLSEDVIEQHAASVPLSRVYQAADEARRRGALWQRFASLLEARAGTPRTV